MKHLTKSLVFILMLISYNHAIGQAFFLNSSATELLDQHIAEFSNGDLLIGNSSTAALRTGDESGVLILERIDHCGNTIWVKEYKYDDGYLVLSDIAVNQDDEIFMFGRNNSQLTESLFIAKIQDPLSGQADLTIYNPGSVDNFTYSMDINNNRLLIYGLLFDFNTSKEGFICVFDHDLNFEKAIKFVPFESSGNAIFSTDGGIVGRSGPFVYKFNRDYEIEWAYKTTDQQDLQNIAGPMESNDGWIFESHNAGQSFLYKLTANGSMQWKSQALNKTNTSGDLIRLDDSRILFAYNQEINDGTALSFYGMSESNPPVYHRKVTHDFKMNTGTIKQRFKDGYISAIGSKNVSATGTSDIEHFILQFNFDEQVYDCFSLDPEVDNLSDSGNISFEQLDVEPEEFDLVLIDRIKLKSTNGESDLEDLCSIGQELTPQVETKLLPCADEWQVSLPNENFQWDDGYVGVDRSLFQVGTYSARNIDCENQEILEFTLEKEECGCEIYLPNIFTPNADSTNDVLELGFFCDLESIDVSIFDRWGERVFRSKNIDSFWSGNINQKEAPAGIYSVIINYGWLDASMMRQEGKIIKTITLLR